MDLYSDRENQGTMGTTGGKTGWLKGSNGFI